MRNVAKLVKQGLEYGIQKRYHFIQGSLAKNALRAVEQYKGKTNPNLLHQSEAYAKEVLGWAGYAPWLKVYAAFNNDFKEGWIPDNYYGSVVVPKIQGDYGKLSNLKLLTNRFFQTTAFPDVLYIVNGCYFTPLGELLSVQEVKKYLFKHHTKVIFKKDNSLQGLGIQVFDKNTFDTEALEHIDNGVFQYFVEQHQFFTQFKSKAVATIRLTTTINKQHFITLNDAYLRLGSLNDLFIASNAQIKVPLNKNTGELFEFGYVNGWEPILMSSKNASDFKELKIPNYDLAVLLCKELHSKAKYVQCIGWDVAIAANGDVKILEWNGYHNDIKFSEATQGPCFLNLGWENLWKTT